MAVSATETVRCDQLQDELAAAGVDVSAGIGTSGEAIGDVFTYDGDGHLVDLPDAAQTVVDAHVPVEPVDPRIAVIEAMESLTDGDKAALIGLIIG
jgi:hypothetical protein